MPNYIKLHTILLLLLVWCVPSTYGGVRGKGFRGGKKFNFKITQRLLRSQRQARPKKVTKTVTTYVPTHRDAGISAGLGQVRIARKAWQETVSSSQSSMMLSRKMQRKLAQDMRPFLYSFEKEAKPSAPAFYDDVYSDIQTAGNLTYMSKAQTAVAEQDYQLAMQSMHEISKEINTNIYYLGTAEPTELPAAYIRRMLEDIAKAQQVVAKAQVSWGVEPRLSRAATYLQNARKFYMTLGTGMYETIVEEGPLKRSDGRVYDAAEFGLPGDQKIPEVQAFDVDTWFVNPRGALPKALKVAILQDDLDVIRGINTMKKKAGLGDWHIDFYDDPEAFLNNPMAFQYDMVLTDVLIKNGGGRYLARQLRSQGYEGSILTLSGFAASVHSGKAFFADGIDGMIALGWTQDWANKIWSGLNAYFLLKEKNGWKH